MPSPASRSENPATNSPTMAPLKTSPRSAPLAVVHVDPASIAHSELAADNTDDGGGTKNAGTARARTRSSHAPSTAANVRIGGRTRRLRLSVFARAMGLEG